MRQRAALKSSMPLHHSDQTATENAVDTHETHALVLAGIEVHQIQHLDEAQLQHLKALAGYGLKPYVWSTPSEHVSHGLRRDCYLTIDLARAALAGVPASMREGVHGIALCNGVTELSYRQATGLQPTAPKADIAPIPEEILCAITVVRCVASQALRYLLLCALGTSNTKIRRSTLKPSTIVKIAYDGLIPVMAKIVKKALILECLTTEKSISETFDTKNVFSCLTIDDLNDLSTNSRTRAKEEFARMVRLAEQGVWSDAPNWRIDPTKTVDPLANELNVEHGSTSDPHKPLPDEYVGTMGQRSLWITTTLGPIILETGQDLLSKFTAAADRGAMGKATRQAIGNKVVKAHFADERLRPAFTVMLSAHGALMGAHRKAIFARSMSPSDKDQSRTWISAKPEDVATNLQAALAWPPKTYAQFLGMCGLLQGAHFFLALLAMASRQSEIMDLPRNCVEERSGRWFGKGKTFKLEQLHCGVDHEWQLPEAVAKALHQQGILAKLLEQLPSPKGNYLSSLAEPEFREYEGKRLWVSVGSSSADHRAVPWDPNLILRRYAQSIGMTTHPGGHSLTTHRFRKTLARLAALTLDESQLLVKRILGHKDIEMTIYYILSDPALAAEIEQVRRELRIARGQKFIEVTRKNVDGNSHATNFSTQALSIETLHQSYGGGAASKLTAIVEKMQISHSDLSLYDQATVLTENGRYFELVRPGVICTKRQGDHGPCSKKRGAPDRAQCQSSCGHRLESPYLREEVDQCMEQAVEAYRRACEEKDMLMKSFWRTQVLDGLHRFEDVKAKWVSQRDVALLLKESS